MQVHACAALAPSKTAPTFCILAVIPRTQTLISLFTERRYSRNCATMASWTGATSGWTWGGGYDDELGDEEGEMELSRVRAAL